MINDAGLLRNTTAALVKELEVTKFAPFLKGENAKNLETLGAARLAELLIEVSTGNAPAKRRLRLELAGAESPAEAGREIRKRLAGIARSRSFVIGKSVRPLSMTSKSRGGR